MLATAMSGTLQGIHALPVQVEVNTGEQGEPETSLVGLPDAAVKESIDRVWSALHNSGFRAPATKTTINLAPGHLHKTGPLFDLPIALAILVATGQLKADKLDTFLIAGELSLSGKTRATSGGLALALLARKLGKAGVLLPPATAEEAALVESVPIHPVSSLDEAARFLSGEKFIARLEPATSPFRRPPDTQHHLDFSEVKGQQSLRRAVEVAVAGGHNLLMVGSPGAGKSMIAKRIPTIMPEPTLDEFLEVLAIQSAAGISLAPENRCFQRPFRSPHHTISEVGLLGGGTIPGPGEISLAHHGVLFMDELPEFKRSTLEVLRQPLEDGEVSISRSAGKITLPCAVMLVAAMNSCPCGYMGDARRECRCTVPQIQRYRSRISGPLLDRIDLHVEAPSLPLKAIQSEAPGETSAVMRERIIAARKRQADRFAGSRHQSPCNARMSQAQIRAHCAIDKAQAELLSQAMEQLSLSARAYDRVLKVARTIADLSRTDRIEMPHLLEAIQYRSLDRTVFY